MQTALLVSGTGPLAGTSSGPFADFASSQFQALAAQVSEGWSHLSLPEKAFLVAAGGTAALCLAAEWVPAAATYEVVGMGATALGLSTPALSPRVQELIGSGLTAAVGLTLIAADGLVRPALLPAKAQDTDNTEDPGETRAPWTPPVRSTEEQIAGLTGALENAELAAKAAHEALAEGTVAASDFYREAERRVTEIERAIAALRLPSTAAPDATPSKAY